MIIVKIELHSALTGLATEIGRMKITNRGIRKQPFGTGTLGDYNVVLMRRGTLDVVQREGSVLNHPRDVQPVWRLVMKALKSVGFDKRTDGDLLGDGEL